MRWLAMACTMLCLAATPARAQAPGVNPPLRDDPGDWWGDVHRWTGSDATRPTRPTPPTARPPTAAPEGTRRVTTSATARANLRREPSTTAEVLRVMRPGSVLIVFGEAPGGWLQVGDGDQPAGWVHRSALQGP